MNLSDAGWHATNTWNTLIHEQSTIRVHLLFHPDEPPQPNQREHWQSVAASHVVTYRPKIVLVMQRQTLENFPVENPSEAVFDDLAEAMAKWGVATIKAMPLEALVEVSREVGKSLLNWDIRNPFFSMDTLMTQIILQGGDYCQFVEVLRRWRMHGVIKVEWRVLTDNTLLTGPMMRAGEDELFLKAIPLGEDTLLTARYSDPEIYKLQRRLT